jgi:c(7)-type cytochrome triheme protein
MKLTTPVISLLAALLLSGNVLAQEPGATAPAVSSVNTFNRLMKPKVKVNPPPMEDEIHDAENPGTTLLQPPKAAFDSLDKSPHGNNVNWVSSLENGKLNPRWDRIDDTMQPIVFDLNIVREVKGSMPNVVYPHKQHTEWLDCSNCHPDIFIPQKGANQINMASILLGEKCGVCHGKVAFPVTTSTCRLCHSQNKENSNLKRSEASLP